jgi:RNA polymerase sigma-70 factor (ECF subfamily)
VDGRPHHERSYDQAELLEQALSRLDPELRCLFVLREIDQLSYRELAKTLGIAEGTVASRLNRARQMLKAHLEKLGWEGSHAML